MCLNVQGALNHYRRKKIRFFSDENGRQIGDSEARAYLKTCLLEGKNVIPMGDCYRFDYAGKGCRGHIKSLMPTDEKMQEIENEYQVFLINKKKY